MSHPVWRAPQQLNPDSLGELQALRAELGRMVGSILAGQSSFGGQSPFASRQASFADVDMQEDESGWTVTARLPGLAPEEVAVDVDDRELCIRARSEAEVNAEIGGEAEGSRRRSFEYQFTIPGEVEPDDVDATMDHGLLTVRLPRSRRSRRRQVVISRRTAGGTGTAATAATGQASPADQPVADQAAATDRPVPAEVPDA